MIINCRGHYTTAPKPLRDYRQRQIDSLKDSALIPKAPPVISDDQIRESLEGAQLKSQRERGVDLTIFSPIAGQMGHHIAIRTWALRTSTRSLRKGSAGSCRRPRSRSAASSRA